MASIPSSTTAALVHVTMGTLVEDPKIRPTAHIFGRLKGAVVHDHRSAAAVRRASLMGPRATANAVAFVIGWWIIAIGVGGILAPAFLIWVARHFLTPLPLYLVAAFRVAFGLLLLVAAPASRAPRVLRIVAFLPLIGGIVLPFLGVERAATMIEEWTQLGSALIRLTALALIGLGGFFAYACRRAR
jgi:hypothetical protein